MGLTGEVLEELEMAEKTIQDLEAQLTAANEKLHLLCAAWQEIIDSPQSWSGEIAKDALVAAGYRAGFSTTEIVNLAALEHLKGKVEAMKKAGADAIGELEFLACRTGDETPLHSILKWYQACAL